MESFDKTWFIGEGNSNLLQYSYLGNTLDSKKGQKDIASEDEPPRSEGVQYATGEEWRAVTNSSRKNEVAGPKQKLHSVVDVSGNENRIWCCKNYWIGAWNVRSMNQGKSKHWHLRNR